MLKKLVCAAVVLAVSFSVAAAEEFFGGITKVDGDKITVMKFKKGEKPEDVVLTLAKKVKVNEATAKFKKGQKPEVTVGDELKGGLKNEKFEKPGKFGVFAQIITNDDNKVTEIRVIPNPFKGKGKGKKPKDD